MILPLVLLLAQAPVNSSAIIVRGLEIRTDPAKGVTEIGIPSPQTANAINVPCGAKLQPVINAAMGGQTIRIAHMQSDGKSQCIWPGTIWLPYRADSGIVTITSDGLIPADGVRTHPGDPYLARIVASSLETTHYLAVETAATVKGKPVHGWRLVGLDITAPDDLAHDSYGLVHIGGYTRGPYTMLDIPHDFAFEHCWIHGANQDQEVGRGIAADVTGLTVLDSTINEIHSTFIEAQAIWVNTSGGGIRIENNDLQGASENVIIGGSPAQVNDIEPSPGWSIRFNYIHKPPEWRGYRHPGSNSPWIMKNLLEIKNGVKGIIIDSNVFEYSWDQSQGGWAVLVTPRFEPPLPGNVEPTKTRASELIFTNNTLRHMVSGIILGLIDTNYPNHGMTPAQAIAVQSANYMVSNNLFDDMDSTAWGNPVSASHCTEWFEGSWKPIGWIENGVMNHNTCNFGPGANINSSMMYYNLFGLAEGPAADSEFSYNLSGFSMTRDAASGPEAVLAGSKFHHNTMYHSFLSQDVWNAAGLGTSVGNLVNSHDNPDGRGANLEQLGALEAQIKKGIRPAGQ